MVKVHNKEKNVIKENMTKMKINTRFRQIKMSTTTLMKKIYLESKWKSMKIQREGGANYVQS